MFGATNKPTTSWSATLRTKYAFKQFPRGSACGLAVSRLNIRFACLAAMPGAIHQLVITGNFGSQPGKLPQ
jgi:hypothetical protein